MCESYGKESRRKSQGKDSTNSISFVYRTLEKQWIFVLNIYVYSKCIYLINRLIDIYTFHIMIYIVFYNIRYCKHSEIYSGSVAGVLEIIHNYCYFIKATRHLWSILSPVQKNHCVSALCYYEISTIEKK